MKSVPPHSKLLGLHVCGDVAICQLTLDVCYVAKRRVYAAIRVQKYRISMASHSEIP